MSDAILRGKFFHQFGSELRTLASDDFPRHTKPSKYFFIYKFYHKFLCGSEQSFSFYPFGDIICANQDMISSYGTWEKFVLQNQEPTSQKAQS